MERLYLATSSIDVMFVSDNLVMEPLETQAKRYFKEQEGPNIHINKIDVQEVLNLNDIPNDWRAGTALLWGTIEDITAIDFLQRTSDPEYIEYLRLKEKFE